MRDREAYFKSLEQFARDTNRETEQALAEIAQHEGCTVDDLKRRFEAEEAAIEEEMRGEPPATSVAEALERLWTYAERAARKQ